MTGLDGLAGDIVGKLDAGLDRHRAELGIELKGRFPSIVFPQLAKDVLGYADLSYQKLAESHEQWPIIGREDLYYGGTGYKNDQGLGVQLAPLGGTVPSGAQAPAMPDADLIAVPVTTLYDHGTTLLPSEILAPRTPAPYLVLNPADADKQKATDGMTVSVTVNGVSSTVVVIVDQNIPAGFALLPRSMGISISEPSAIEIRMAEGQLV